MGEFIGLIFFILISVIVLSAKKKGKGSISGSFTGEKPEEEAEIKEQAQKFFDAVRQKQSSANSLGASGLDKQSAASPAQPERRTVREEKPIIGHSADDCTGGSIHDGYHEGTDWKQGKPMPRKMPETAPEGAPVKGSDHSIHFKEAEVKENHVSGAEKLTALLSEKPSIVQGVIWSELLGRPKSERDIMQ
ncbi:MAG: hypothetical protein ACI4OB_02200 [Christensenellales bacterium]